jgi:choline dehydrogenase-like flavoprotein
VLAAGGLENPRLLLASSASTVGLGNDHGLVGRFFMEHPHARGGRVTGARSWTLLKAFRRRRRNGQVLAALIAASADAQSRTQMLNSSLTIAARQPAGAIQFWAMRAYQRAKREIAPTRAGRALWMHTKRAANWVQRNADPLRPWLLHSAGRLELALLVRAEQAPHPDSRVVLSDRKDALGVPQLKLDWRLSALDVHSVETLVDLVGGEFRRLGLGEVIKADWLSARDRVWRSDPLISAHPIGGYHHMGTTRMADNPRRGVTNGFGQVHGVENLYVAGSSLFPTSGWANPTLTVVALALRTGDHIARRIAGREQRPLQPAVAISGGESVRS